MLVAELQELEEVKNLLSKGQQVGVLTFGEIATAVSEVDVDEGDIEELYGHLERSGIELVEDVDPAQTAAPERDDGKRGKRRTHTFEGIPSRDRPAGKCQETVVIVIHPTCPFS